MTPSEVRKEYLQLLPELQQAVQIVQNKLKHLPEDLEWEVNFKTLPSIINKLKRKNAKNILELSDLVRGRVFFPPQYTYDKIKNIIKSLFGDQITNINQKDKCEFGLEYHGIVHADLNINGIKFELQLIPTEFKPYKELLHFIYEQFKNHNQLSDHQKQFFRNMHNQLYKKLDDKAKKNRK